MGRLRLPWLLALCALSVAAPAPQPRAQSAAMAGLLDYARAQNTTGFLIIRDGRTLVEENWPAPADDPLFAMLAYDRNKDGALLEDVASCPSIRPLETPLRGTSMAPQGERSRGPDLTHDDLAVAARI